MLERTDHGQASQDAFALLSELEAREASIAAPRGRAAGGAGSAPVARRRRRRRPARRELDERESALVAREAELNLLQRRLAAVAASRRTTELDEQLRAELQAARGRRRRPRACDRRAPRAAREPRRIASPARARGLDTRDRARAARGRGPRPRGAPRGRARAARGQARRPASRARGARGAPRRSARPTSPATSSRVQQQLHRGLDTQSQPPGYTARARGCGGIGRRARFRSVCP